MAGLAVTEFTDSGCPWAYSASPALAVLRWRYGAQLEWRTVMIGLADDPQVYVERGYTTTRAAVGVLSFKRYGMPFAAEPRARVLATYPGCRAVIATRILFPERERDVLRALQFAWFNTTLLLDEPDQIAQALRAVDGLDVERVVAAIDTPEVEAAFAADREETRRAEGGPTEFQGKARQTDGPVRYSAPSLIFEAQDGRVLEAGGFQTIEAYDVCVANLDTTLDRRAPAESAVAALAAFPGGLVTQEVAAVMTHNNMPVDRYAAETQLIEAAGDGSVTRTPLGDDALWRIA
ncbi:MAG TPA: DsbA family protein [Solirubrobacteraceae bacterium]|nr:DsbA family protein [Solirubrobacteraceae bacterium]